MNIKKTQVDFTCPDCGSISKASIGVLEGGQYTCTSCLGTYTFDPAQATKMRADIEDNLTDLIDIFKRLGK